MNTGVSDASVYDKVEFRLHQLPTTGNLGRRADGITYLLIPIKTELKQAQANAVLERRERMNDFLSQEYESYMEELRMMGKSEWRFRPCCLK